MAFGKVQIQGNLIRRSPFGKEDKFPPIGTKVNWYGISSFDTGKSKEISLGTLKNGCR